MIEAQQN